MSPRSKHSPRSHWRFALVLAAMLPIAAHAQGSGVLGGDRTLPPTPTPVGSGARAAGMANAFIAIADDATAASWNPAGLVQLERAEISIVGSASFLRDDFSSRGLNRVGGGDPDNAFDLNYASFAYPLPFTVLGRNATVSLNYQRKFDFNRALDAHQFRASVAPLAPPLAIAQRSRLSFNQEGSLSALSPAAAIEITHRLSVGLAVNFWRDLIGEGNGWEQRTTVSGLTLVGRSPSLSRVRSREKYEDFTGENFTLGLLWKPTSRWSLGLRYDSAFTGKADYQASDLQIAWTPLSNPLRPIINFRSIDEKRRIRIPDTLAAGVAFRPNDRLTVALDLSRTDWNDFYVTTPSRGKFSLVDGTDLRNPRQKTHSDPAYSLRLGGEYVFLPEEPGEDLPRLWSMRTGLFYEEEPATQRSTRNFFSRGNGEADRFYGGAFGLGLLLGGRYNFDLAYQVRYGPGVNRDLNPGLRGFDDDEIRHTFLASVVIYF